MRLHLVPISLAQANEHVEAWHRHNRPVVGCKFCIGVADEEGVWSTPSLPRADIGSAGVARQLWEVVA